ncbi:MAG TPA: metal ABC transporter substrate-binding protein [Symbiobacteriaceae bacterium]|nr:metal ABC transporter substrate-binding protein [Symbiobacteriaceae bacterium]
MQKKRGMALLAGALALALAGCGAATQSTDSSKVKVAVSFYGLEEWTKIVGGDRVQVTNLVPPGVEPHEWEPNPSELKTLEQAKAFFYVGAGYEHWVDQTLTAIGKKDLVAVEASHGFALLESGAHEGETGHDHGGLDPHIWLDPQGAIQMVKAVRDGLIQADPAGKAIYTTNAEAYMAKVEGLDQKFAAGLKSCKSDEIFVTHEAYGYLAHRYNLHQHAVLGLSPETEPDPKTLAELIKVAKAEGVKVIFTETVASNKLTEVLAKEVGARTLTLHTFENLTDDERKAGADYIKVMEQNLANLKQGLECGN